ncbi:MULTISPECIES: hypothetical protein [unclassified Yoonia]|uniref:hypothetical protein n=1 Tax=unclassified Yoonia TaxID=2629118 RepID=UPI002AFF5A44|nr:MULTISPECIES: hypothetical protein [unclassified Yoonia]
MIVSAAGKFNCYYYLTLGEVAGFRPFFGLTLNDWQVLADAAPSRPFFCGKRELFALRKVKEVVPRFDWKIICLTSRPLKARLGAPNLLPLRMY